MHNAIPEVILEEENIRLKLTIQHMKDELSYMQDVAYAYEYAYENGILELPDREDYNSFKDPVIEDDDWE